MNLISSLTTDRKFAPFFWVQFLGVLNDNIIKNMLVILIAYKNIELLGVSSESLIALAGAIFILPFVLFSPFAGALADKYSKVKIARVTKEIELVIMVLATYGFFQNNFLVLLICLFLMGVQSTFFGPVKYSIIPSLVERKYLTKGNAYVEFGTFIAILLGTIGGGLLSKYDSWQILGGTLCLVSLVGVVASYLQPPMPLNKDSAQVRLSWNIFAGFKDTYSELVRKENVFSAVFLISCFWFFGAGLLTVLPTYCQKTLNVNEDVVTLFLAMFTVGIGLGSLACSYFSKHKIEIGLVPIGFLGLFIFVVDFYIFNLSWVTSEQVVSFTEFLSNPLSLRVLVDFLLISFFGGIFIVPLYAYIQDKADYNGLSRVIAANNIMNALFMVVVSLFIIIFYSLGLSPALSFLLVGFINFVACLLVFVLNKEFKNLFFQYIGKTK